METFERPQQPIESAERKQLKELEATGRYVFHGSGADFDELEPRQAVDSVIGPDGDPSVHASQIADYAIFMAVLAPLGHTRAGTTESDASLEPIVNYGATKSAMDKLTDETSGWVYVCDRKDFRQRRSAEWVCDKPVRPAFKIRVSKRDLPKNVEIF